MLFLSHEIPELLVRMCKSFMSLADIQSAVNHINIMPSSGSLYVTTCSPCNPIVPAILSLKFFPSAVENKWHTYDTASKTLFHLSWGCFSLVIAENVYINLILYFCSLALLTERFFLHFGTLDCLREKKTIP